MSDISVFLKALWRNAPPGDQTLFVGWLGEQPYWTHYPRTQGAQVLKVIDAWGQDARHVFIRPGRYRAGATKAVDEALRWICTIHVDVDFKDHPGLAPKEIVARLKAHPEVPPPTILVKTGGGVHAYWRLTEPLDCNDPHALPRAREAMMELARIFGGDTAAAKPGQAMRVPGTLNPKYDPPRPVECRVFDDSEISFEDLEAALYGARQTIPEDPDADIIDADLIRLRVIARRTKEKIARSSGETMDHEAVVADLNAPGHRNNAVAKMAGSLFNEGYSVEEAQVWIADKGDLYDRKTADTVASIARKARRGNQTVFDTYEERAAAEHGPPGQLQPQATAAFSTAPPPSPGGLTGGLPFRGRQRGYRATDPINAATAEIGNTRAPHDVLLGRINKRM